MESEPRDAPLNSIKQEFEGTSSNQLPQNVVHLQILELAAKRDYAKESKPVIIMSSEEYAQTKQKLTHTVEDMNKIGRRVQTWYDTTKDHDGARRFFRARLRIVDQFADGEQMVDAKDVLSIDCAELDRINSLLQGMARELFHESDFNSHEPTRG